MPRIITDADLQVWEVYPSSGPFGLPERPKVVFNCLTDSNRRPRWVVMNGDDAEVEKRLGEMNVKELLQLLGESTEIR